MPLTLSKLYRINFSLTPSRRDPPHFGATYYQLSNSSPPSWLIRVHSKHARRALVREKIKANVQIEILLKLYIKKTNSTFLSSKKTFQTFNPSLSVTLK